MALGMCRSLKSKEGRAARQHKLQADLSPEGMADENVWRNADALQRAANVGSRGGEGVRTCERGPAGGEEEHLHCSAHETDSGPTTGAAAHPPELPWFRKSRRIMRHG